MTIDRSNPIAIRLLALMAKDEGWSARWLGSPDWLNHSSGLIVYCEPQWTLPRWSEDTEPPHLLLYIGDNSPLRFHCGSLPIPI